MPLRPFGPTPWRCQDCFAFARSYVLFVVSKSMHGGITFEYDGYAA